MSKFKIGDEVRHRVFKCAIGTVSGLGRDMSPGESTAPMPVHYYLKEYPGYRIMEYDLESIDRMTTDPNGYVKERLDDLIEREQKAVDKFITDFSKDKDC